MTEEEMSVSLCELNYIEADISKWMQSEFCPWVLISIDGVLRVAMKTESHSHGLFTKGLMTYDVGMLPTILATSTEYANALRAELTMMGKEKRIRGGYSADL